MKLGNLEHSFVQRGYIPTYPEIEIEAESEKYLNSVAKGYTGDKCNDCKSYLMVSFGTGVKCDCCGSTKKEEKKSLPTLASISGSFQIQTATGNITQETNNILLNE